MTRRNWLSAAGAAAQVVSAQAQTSGISDAVIANANRGVENLLGRQVLDPKSRFRGGIADADGLFSHGTVGAIVEVFGAAYLCDRTKYYKNPLLIERMQLAVDWVMRGISKEGNIDLPITNFNSTPDTAFFTNPVATIAVLARRYKAPEVTAIVEPLLRRVGQGLLHGGVHTPNHRWVVTSALAQLHELFGGTEYLNRANQWLNEGIDMDPDGQFSERSTTVYNTVSDRGLTIAAIKLKRPDLLEYVRRNLDSMMYLLHPGNEVVTEISKRQDKNVRAKPDRYWFPAKYLAVQDNNGLYEAFAQAGINGQQLSLLLEYPELQKPVQAKPLPENYVKVFPTVGIGRIRRGKTSATLQFTGADRVFCLRRGDVVMNGIRFASAFFGKAQFIPTSGGPKGKGYEFTQSLEGPYYQPLDAKPEPPIIYHDQWGASWKNRKKSGICKLTQSATVTEDANGFSVRIQASGTDDVPLAVEISLAPGGVLEGCEKLKGEDQYLLPEGKTASYRVGSDVLKFGPGLSETQYVNVRGALPKLDGTSVYLTGYTPFDRTIRFEWA
ncbi:hypothetical protein F183_A19000 [Bryobacterales bacterium F-183]|nr:hypothetical protein F183_A19000 [Bryobacterales bacterium F-183]